MRDVYSEDVDHFFLPRVAEYYTENLQKDM